MAKRFTDTNKYKNSFIRGLQGPYKVLWDYLYHDCDHAGIWIKDFEIAKIYIGSDLPVDEETAIKVFGERVLPIHNNEKWFIPSFIEFQYGELNEANRAHLSVINILIKENVYSKNKGLVRSLQGYKDKDKDKDKDKGDIAKLKTYQTFFEEFWEVYPKRKGKKVGKKKAFENFQKIAVPHLVHVISNAKNYGINNEYPKDPERFLKDDFWKEWDAPQSTTSTDNQPSGRI